MIILPMLPTSLQTLPISSMTYITLGELITKLFSVMLSLNIVIFIAGIAIGLPILFFIIVLKKKSAKLLLTYGTFIIAMIFYLFAIYAGFSILIYPLLEMAFNTVVQELAALIIVTVSTWTISTYITYYLPDFLIEKIKRESSLQIKDWLKSYKLIWILASVILIIVALLGG